MNIYELKSLLSNRNYHSGIVSYNEGEKVGGYNIQECHGIWRLFLVDDKGNVSNEIRFRSESELCKYVINFAETEHKKLEEALNKIKNMNKKKINIPNVIYL